MRGISRCDLAVKLAHALLHQLQLPADQLHPQRETSDHGLFIGHRHGFFNQGQALLHQLRAPAAVEIIKLFQGGGFGLLHGLQARPFQQERRGQRPPEVITAQYQGLREV